MADPLDYQRHDPTTHRGPWSIAALIGLPLGVCGTMLAFILCVTLRQDFLIWLMPISTIAALYFSLVGGRETAYDATARKSGRSVAVAGVLVNLILMFFMLLLLMTMALMR